MIDTLPFLASAAVFGLSGGLTPGPLSTLIVLQTVRYGAGEGIKIALAPFLTDGPIAVGTLLLLSLAPNRDAVLASVSMIGAVFLAVVALQTFRVRALEVEACQTPPRSILLGTLANVLNPHPYLFWAAVGGPMLFKARAVNPTTAVLFVTVFYTCLVGSKVTIALLTARARTFLRSPAYRTVLRILALLLLVFGVVLLWDGVRYWIGEGRL